MVVDHIAWALFFFFWISLGAMAEFSWRISVKILAFFPFYCDILRSSHCWVGEQSLSFIPDANCYVELFRWIILKLLCYARHIAE